MFELSLNPIGSFYLEGAVFNILAAGTGLIEDIFKIEY